MYIVLKSVRAKLTVDETHNDIYLNEFHILLLSIDKSNLMLKPTISIQDIGPNEDVILKDIEYGRFCSCKVNAAAKKGPMLGILISDSSNRWRCWWAKKLTSHTCVRNVSEIRISWHQINKWNQTSKVKPIKQCISNI